jgi:hypothetical protein
VFLIVCGGGVSAQASFGIGCPAVALFQGHGGDVAKRPTHVRDVFGFP